MKRALFHGKRKLDAELISTQYGLCWKLAASEFERFKRMFIPYSGGKYSMIQKVLGLKEK